MRVVVFFSGGASSLKYIMEKDPNFGNKYKVVGCFTDIKDASAIAMVRQFGIPLRIHDIRDWYRARDRKIKDLEIRPEYFREIAELIREFRADLIMLSGFMRIVTEPLLTQYKGRILNVHPADLTILDEKGERKYTGMNVVQDAFKAGEKYTKSTVHIATEKVDGGEIVALSDPLYFESGVSPKEHQEKMKTLCDGPAYAKALEIMAERLKRP